jgi:hypothetical protein
MTPERGADKEKCALFRAVAFFLSELKLGITNCLITLNIAQLSENFKLTRAAKKAHFNLFLGDTSALAPPITDTLRFCMQIHREHSNS